MTTKQPDWERIEQLFRAGLLSVREIAAACGVSHTAINKRTIRHLDAEELEMLFPVRAGNRVSAHKRAAVGLLQADHHELTVLEAQARVAGALEAEQSVVPVMNTEDTLVVHVAHVRRTPGDWSARALRLLHKKERLRAIASHSNGSHNIC